MQRLHIALLASLRFTPDLLIGVLPCRCLRDAGCLIGMVVGLLQCLCVALLSSGGLICYCAVGVLIGRGERIGITLGASLHLCLVGRLSRSDFNRNLLVCVSMIGCCGGTLVVHLRPSWHAVVVTADVQLMSERSSLQQDHRIPRRDRAHGWIQCGDRLYRLHPIGFRSLCVGRANHFGGCRGVCRINVALQRSIGGCARDNFRSDIALQHGIGRVARGSLVVDVALQCCVRVLARCGLVV